MEWTESEVKTQGCHRPDSAEPCGLRKDSEWYSEGKGELFKRFEQRRE